MRVLIMVAVMLLCAACAEEKAPVGPAVVVYASEDDPAGLSELFGEFTDETGIPVSVIWADSRVNTNDVIHKQGEPADVLITPNIAGVWLAAEQGALRPLKGEAVASVDSLLKDPDLMWVSLAKRFAAIASSTTGHGVGTGAYKNLGDNTFQGKLCLSSINNSINQAVIAMLIEDFGLKQAERIVRGWIRNLELPPFETEAKLVAALQSGTCQLGIISDAANTVDLNLIGPVPVYADVSAMGIGRHARNPERAQQLVDWLILNNPLGGLANSNGQNLGVIGWRNEEVMLLAERAAYR